MSGFSVEWLTLRESYDRRARNPAVLDVVTSLFGSKSAVRVVDLACGTGSTLRTLAMIEVPPGILTAVVGTPVFIALLARARRTI